MFLDHINLDPGEEAVIRSPVEGDSIEVEYRDIETGESRCDEIFAGTWVERGDDAIRDKLIELQQKLRKGLD